MHQTVDYKTFDTFLFNVKITIYTVENPVDFLLY